MLDLQYLAPRKIICSLMKVEIVSYLELKYERKTLSLV